MLVHAQTAATDLSTVGSAHDERQMSGSTTQDQQEKGVYMYVK